MLLCISTVCSFLLPSIMGLYHIVCVYTNTYVNILYMCIYVSISIYLPIYMSVYHLNALQFFSYLKNFTYSILEKIFSYISF